MLHQLSVVLEPIQTKNMGTCIDESREYKDRWSMCSVNTLPKRASLVGLRLWHFRDPNSTSSASLDFPRMYQVQSKASFDRLKHHNDLSMGNLHETCYCDLPYEAWWKAWESRGPGSRVGELSRQSPALELVCRSPPLVAVNYPLLMTCLHASPQIVSFSCRVSSRAFSVYTSQW